MLIMNKATIHAGGRFHWKDQYHKVNSPTPEMRREAWERWGHLRD